MASDLENSLVVAQLAMGWGALGVKVANIAKIVVLSNNTIIYIIH